LTRSSKKAPGAGGLISYGASEPVIINLRTAKALRLDVPDRLLTIVDQVIE